MRKNFRKVFADRAGGRIFYFGGRKLGGSRNFEVKIKVDNTSIKSILE